MTLAFDPVELRKVRERLVPLHERTHAPRPGEWLHDHPEPGQTLDQYLRSNPTRPTENRRTIVVAPLGELDTSSARIVALASEYLQRHFGLPTRMMEPIQATIPARARRKGPEGEQLLTRYLLDKVLAQRLPNDAAALLGFTATDLWPGEGWNYVFGEASLTERVGVWSLRRYGDPSASEAAFRLALLRTLKIAAHETGHMFSLEHCTAYPCVQAGTNSLEETDASPLWLCPDCLPKIAWATNTDPIDRLRQTAEMCEREALKPEAAFMKKCLEAVLV